jgi:hypothetical protein
MRPQQNMGLWTSLAKPRQASYKVFSVVFGGLVLCAGLAFGIAQNFANWPGVSFLLGIGAALIAAGLLLSEASLVRVAYALLWANFAVAIFSLLNAWSQ